MPRSPVFFEKNKQVLHQKGRFPCEKQAFGWGVMIINLGKVNSFIIEQIGIIEFCPLTIIVLTTRILTC